MDEQERPLRVVIVYYSRFGAIGALAAAVAEGVQSVVGAQAELVKIDDEPLGSGPDDTTTAAPAEGAPDPRARRAALLGQLATADALIVGAPSYFGSMASPVKRFFEDVVTSSSAILDRTRPWHQPFLHDKVGAAFATSATPHGGNEQTLHSILTMLMHLGVIVVTPGQRGPILEHGAAPYGATVVTGATGNRPLTDGEREEARFLGRRVAEVAWWVRDGKDAAIRRVREGAGSGARGYDPSA